MNLAFYVDKTSDTELNKQIFNLLNDAIDQNLVGDACLFYNEVDFNPGVKKFGSFNSTDIWFFSGTLVVTTLGLLPLASKIVNKINLVYLYDKINEQNKGIVNLLAILCMSDKIKVCTTDTDSEKEFYRLTGKKIPVLNKFDAKEILGVV